MQRILLVEDNEMNRDLISRRLKRRGFEVILAVDGAEGVEKATADQPDLIVMDMGLPVLDGYEATQMLKDTDATRRIPIIGLSAHAMSGDARKALTAGCDDYDTKPVEWARLLEKIDVLLARAQQDATETVTQTPDREEGDVSPKAAHLLVIDDSAMHREMLAGRLASLGYSFDLAADAESALALLAEKQFDVVLLDVTLPSVEGQPLLERIRADPRLQDQPILMLSTIDATRKAIECLSRGAVDFVPQPFHAAVLATRITSCLERASCLQRSRSLEEQLQSEKRRSEHLLETLLPVEMLAELRETRKILPRQCSGVAVLFGDIVGFRNLSDALAPHESIRRLQRIILAFEEVAEHHQLLKIKTVGDSFMAAAGLFGDSASAALDALRCGLAMQAAVRDLEADWEVRIGIHHGPVVAGVVGHRKVQFDLWGATVQTAARVKSAGPDGGVYVSDAVWQGVSRRATGKRLGEAKLKGGGTVAIHRVDRVATGA